MKIVTLEMNAFYYCIQRKNLFSLVDTVAVSGVAVFILYTPKRFLNNLFYYYIGL